MKFSMVDCKTELDDRLVYLTEIIDNVQKQGLISEIIKPIYQGWGEAIEPCEVFEDDTFKCKCKYADKTEEYIFTIIFEYGTYPASKQLYVEIQSDNYIVKIEGRTSYLEVLKNALKKQLIEDWNKCLWLYDSESELFSRDLYPKIHETENLFRQFINEVMSKALGANWWNEYAPLDLKTKRKNRISAYKATAPSFQNVDEVLMVIDIGDLIKIAQLKMKRWQPTFDQDINDMLNKLQSTNLDKIIGIIEKQSNVEIDMWGEYFSKYLPSSFIEDFGVFESNRNHIAHNKLIDRQAYEHILQSVDGINKNINAGLKKFYNQVVSEEQKVVIECDRQIEEEQQEVYYEELMESEANIEIRSDDEIYELYENALFEMYHDIEEYFRFRNDLEISDLNRLVFEPDRQELFKIKYKINNKSASIACNFEIDNSQGATSEMELIITLDAEIQSFIIPYVNGEALYNSEQGYYMPETEDEFGYAALEEAKESIIEYLNSKFENLRDKVDSDMFGIIKDGGTGPLADISCLECGEEYVCVDENYAEYGRCLNCGEMNSIVFCERCGCYFEGNVSDYSEGVPQICDNCVENMMAE